MYTLEAGSFVSYLLSISTKPKSASWRKRYFLPYFRELAMTTNDSYNPGQKYWDDLQISSQTVPPPPLPHTMLIRCCVYLQSKWFQLLSTLFGGRGGLLKLQRQLNKNLGDWFKICRIKLFTDNAILCPVPRIFGQDCSNNHFWHGWPPSRHHDSGFVASLCTNFRHLSLFAHTRSTSTRSLKGKYHGVFGIFC